jgi:hypothetical protein
MVVLEHIERERMLPLLLLLVFPRTQISQNF